MRHVRSPANAAVVLLGMAAFLDPAATAQQLRDVTFAAVDVETTGFSARNDRIIEIGVVTFRDGRILEQRSWLVNPRTAIPEAARAVHGIDAEIIRGAPSFRDVYPSFLTFVEGTVLLAHQASFDMAFLAAEARRHGQTLTRNPVLDSLKLARSWFPDAPAHGLSALVGHLGIEQQANHRALDDARALVSVFLRGLNRQTPPPTLDELLRAAGTTLPDPP